MTRERWEDISAMIKDKFAVVSEGKEELTDSPGTVEFVEFNGPLGHLRCEYTVRPTITGKRAIGGHKVGSGSKVQYEFSDKDETAFFKAYKSVNGEWEEMSSSMFS